MTTRPVPAKHNPRRRSAFALETLESRQLLSGALPAADPRLSAAPALDPLVTSRPIRPGDTLTLSVPIANDADNPAYGFDYKLYLSADATLDSSDIPFATSGPIGLDAHAANTWTQSVTLPVDLADQPYYPIVVLSPDPDYVGYTDADLSNNVLAGTPISVARPHVTLLSVSVPDTPVEYNGSFSITLTALVTGYQAGDSAINLDFFFDNPATTANNGGQPLQPGSILLRPDVAGSATPVLVHIDATFTFDHPIPPGTYTVRPHYSAQPDFGGPIQPSPIDIDPSLVAPTILVTASTSLLLITVPHVAGVHPGQPSTFTYTVTNVGSQPSPATTISLAVVEGGLTTNPVPSTPSDPLEPLILDPLAPGESRTVTFTRTIPSAGFGTNQLRASTASDSLAFFGSFSHSDYTTLNRLFDFPDPFPPVTPPIHPFPFPPVTIPDLPVFLPPVELVVLGSLASTPAAVTPGSAVRITAGLLDPVTTSVPVVLSTNDIFGDADDIILGSLDFAVTSTGSAANDDFVLTVPANTPAGTYRLLTQAPLIAGAADAAPTVTVLTPAVGGSVTVNAKRLALGSTATFNLALTNRAPRPVTRKFNVAYYLSADAVFSPDDVLVSRHTFTVNLPAAGTRAKSVPFTTRIPATAPVGSRRLIAVVDPATGKAPASHVEAASRPLLLTGPHVTASVLSVRAGNRADASKVTVRLSSDGTAPFNRAITLSLFSQSSDKPLLAIRKVLSLKPGKYLDVTLAVPASPLNTFRATLS